MHLPSLFATVTFLLSTRTWGVAGAKTFVVPHTAGKDDAPAVRAALASYRSDSTILFQKGITYNILTPIDFGTLTNVEIAIEGNITLPAEIPVVQAIVADSSFPGHWFKIKGTNVTLRGTPDPKWGWVDAHGQAWWDAMEQTNRPHGWNFQVTDGVLKDMKLWKPIAWNFALSGGKNIRAFNNQIHAKSNSNGFPFNTDGFAAGGTNLLIEDNMIINGDDCITVGNGANGVHFRNNYCEGGHGLSIGSLGKGGQMSSVQNVLIENTVMVDELYGARFKSWTGGAGLARNITWKNITLRNVPFPIYITQNYWDQNLGPKPNSTSNSSTAIDTFNFINFVGDQEDKPYKEGTCISDPCWYYVEGATGKEVIIFDLYPGTATNVKTKNILVRPQTGAAPRVMCDPTTVTSDPGFICQNGLYRPT
ncbi:glycoside hydrolase family 28 protein [Botryobasidium botryosum FD-172 SS1]|uniref:galacturonan 1,4-alpha-galacturonidase n=1 Tax=Botryobasidium botryosum (strain FD-172 SS1) TaxID=930990 RepID=A0A067N8Q2_BOTB1|nr:glycoside hydrolase family 28 protein [Botryobasidium botryosum FD-172 SS1]